MRVVSVRGAPAPREVADGTDRCLVLMPREAAQRAWFPYEVRPAPREVADGTDRCLALTPEAG